MDSPEAAEAVVAQARMSRAIPIDRNIILNQMLLEANLGISRETSWEQTGGYENVQKEVRASRRQQMADAMFQQVVMPKAIACAAPHRPMRTPSRLAFPLPTRDIIEPIAAMA